MNLGLTEVLLIAGIALLMFGPSRLPSLGKSIGEAIRGFKKGLNEDETLTQARPVNEQIQYNNEQDQQNAASTANKSQAQSAPAPEKTNS